MKVLSSRLTLADRKGRAYLSFFSYRRFRQLLVAGIVLSLWISTVGAVETARVIQRDGWSFDQMETRAKPEQVEASKAAGRLNVLTWAQYNIAIPRTGWYELWMGGCPPEWPRDVFVDGKTITRLGIAMIGEDTLRPVPRKGIQFKEVNLFLTEGEHTLRVRRLEFPHVLPSVWELRPSEARPGGCIRATVEGARVVAPGGGVKVEVMGGTSVSTEYELFLHNEATQETEPVGKVEFPASKVPVAKAVDITLKAEGLYTLVAKSGGEWLRPSDLKTGYLLAVKSASTGSSTPNHTLRFAGIFNNGVVLQREKPLPVWGWTKPGDQVAVSLAGKTATTVADENGRWQVTFKAFSAGGPYELKAVGGDSTSIVCKDVLIGEVWLLSGQSNMGGDLRSCRGKMEQGGQADYPEVRQADVFAACEMGDHVKRITAGWLTAEFGASPKKFEKWRQIHYAFGTELYQNLRVPIGVIADNRGGTCISTWLSKEVHQKEPSLRPVLDQAQGWEKDRVLELVLVNGLAENFRKWRKNNGEALAAGKPALPSLKLIDRPKITNYSALNYETLIEPLAPFAIRGVLWYQGESDSGMAAAYRERFPALIQSWRQLWKTPDMPFLYVQIAYGSGKLYTGEPGDNPGAELKSVQLETLSVPHTAMAVTNDLMQPEDNIHYHNKLPVGHRLALAALATVYDKPLEYSGPIYKKSKIEDGKIRLFFDHAAGGLVAAGDRKLGGFAIAGEDRKWSWADAKIDGKTVVVRSPNVPKPVAVRYSWTETPCGGNLYNQAGLPSPVFRTDNWPMTTVGIESESKY